ncbi:hypothetical protein MTR_6g452480 [Medicago truncatula]|uniref:Uncharacterized protein n=1 Tax=Medicago truncatula TaxID=3880 RepID=A0A072U923_MEDTR|nr:hypothetical protein MTR_6g452480 [Medicago truncatula]
MAMCLSLGYDDYTLVLVHPMFLYQKLLLIWRSFHHRSAAVWSRSGLFGADPTLLEVCATIIASKSPPLMFYFSVG